MNSCSVYFVNLLFGIVVVVVHFILMDSIRSICFIYFFY